VNDPNLDPLPPDLAALFAREEGAYPEDASMKRDVLAHVELAATLGGPPGGSPGGGPKGGAPQVPSKAAPSGGGASGAARAAIPGGARVLAAAVISAFAAGGVVGGLVVKSSISAPISAPSAIVAVGPIASSSALPLDARHDDDAGSAPIAASVAAPIAAAPSASAAAPKPRGDLTLEREILDAANAALAHGRPADALALAERHAEQWPRGFLGEEREVVRIQALAASGRRDEAQRRATAFRASHPKSMLLPAIDAAVPPEK
jgi:hypothetical protein